MQKNTSINANENNSIKRKNVAIAVAASVISDVPHLREKTSKIGLIGRAAAIFRVSDIIIYPDNPKMNQNADVDLIVTLLSYMETPQYLRKRLFRIEPRLQYAGILPPLRTPHHPLPKKDEEFKVSEYREGIVISKSKNSALVDIGMKHPAVLFDKQVETNKRLTVKITRFGEHTEVQTVNRSEVPVYWGYTVTTKHSLRETVETGDYDLTIGTSRYGTNFTEVSKKIEEQWMRASSVLLGFGSPARGLYEIARDEGGNLNKLVDFVVNTLPNQGTETIRTEEALLASLAILNVQFGF